MKRLIKNQSNLFKNQSGAAAILITMIITVIMGVIVLGISEVSSLNARKSVDSELGVQANYAAETGVNDAIAALQSGDSLPSATGQTCSTFITDNNLSNVISTSPKIAYTCLIISGTPTTLQDNVSDVDSTVLRIDPSSPTSTLTFSWPSSNAGGNPIDCSMSFEFVPLSNWDCPYPVLRIDIFDEVTGTTYTTSNSLAQDTGSFFLFPVDSSVGTGTTSLTLPQTIPQVVAANCTAGTCTEAVNMPAGFQDGYVRMTSIYGSPTGPVTINGNSGAGFANAQVEIDSTGIDQDELQRIDVRVAITNTSAAPSAPNYSVDAGYSFCKRYTLSGPGSEPVPDIPEDEFQPPDFFSSTGYEFGPLCGYALKPAIYLYPTHTEPVNVKISYPTGLATSIPTYNASTGWNVIAQPDGSLTNISDNKTYPYLYWEGNPDNFNFNMNQGFVVSGKDTSTFLKKELAIIGLNNNEIAGFLQYWVPKMENNPYSLIHFAGSDYTKMAPLTISPQPNSVLRVFMAEEPINSPIKVTPQHFTTFKRSGFTVVEWGGTVLN